MAPRRVGAGMAKDRFVNSNGSTWYDFLGDGSSIVRRRKQREWRVKRHDAEVF